MQICQNPYAIFESTKSVLLQTLHQSSMPSNIAPLYFFLAHTLCTLVKGAIKEQFFRSSSDRIKICKIPHVNFEMTSQALFKFCIILHCQDT